MHELSHLEAAAPLEMDRYAVVEVRLSNGQARTADVFFGEAGAERAHHRAQNISYRKGYKGFVVGL